MVPGDILILQVEFCCSGISMQTAGYALHRGCISMRASWMMSLGSGGAGDCIRSHHRGTSAVPLTEAGTVAVLRKPANNGNRKLLARSRLASRNCQAQGEARAGLRTSIFSPTSITIKSSPSSIGPS